MLLFSYRHVSHIEKTEDIGSNYYAILLLGTYHVLYIYSAKHKTVSLQHGNGYKKSHHP